tara:strand:+ start:1529 stop:1762 length:234 start_codon:yes stop_codon:yes gene_type:complete
MTGTVTETNRQVESISVQAPRGNSRNFGFTIHYTNGNFRQTWQPIEWIAPNYQNWAERQGVNFENLPPVNFVNYPNL